MESGTGCSEQLRVKAWEAYKSANGLWPIGEMPEAPPECGNGFWPALMPGRCQSNGKPIGAFMVSVSCRFGTIEVGACLSMHCMMSDGSNTPGEPDEHSTAVETLESWLTTGLAILLSRR